MILNFVVKRNVYNYSFVNGSLITTHTVGHDRMLTMMKAHTHHDKGKTFEGDR